MIPSDIEDNVRWDTTETEWSDYDALWEPVGGEEAIRWRFEIEWEAVISAGSAPI